MYYLSAILISFIIGLLRRGSIRALIEHPYKKWLLGFIGILILIVLHFSYLFIDQIGFAAPFLPILNFVGYLLLLLMFIFNLDDIFSILIALGLTFDFIVTFINGGLMPVAQSVVDLMPQNMPLTQNIINMMSVTYSISVAETLLGFLGIILPVPFLVRYMVLLGTVPGLSIGKAFILVGLLGLVQAAMKLPVEKKIKEEVINEQVRAHSRPRPEPAGVSQNTSHFDSLTEELFFEDNPLPNDPLDKIFAGDRESQETKHLDRIKELRKTKSETEDLSDLDREVEMLTKPLGTGIINSKEIREHIINGEQEEIKDEINGFFSQEFKDKNKLKTEEIFTPEVTEAETKIIETPLQETEPVEVIETQPLEDIVTAEIEEIPETEATQVFEDIKEVPEVETTQVFEGIKEVKDERPVILLAGPEEETDIKPDIFMTQDQYASFINSIEDEEFLNEFQYYLSQFRGEAVSVMPIREKKTLKTVPLDNPEVTQEISLPESEEFPNVKTEDIIIPEVQTTEVKEEPTAEIKIEEPIQTEIESTTEIPVEEAEPVIIRVEEPIKETQVKESAAQEDSLVVPKPRKRQRKKVGLIPEQEETKVHMIVFESNESEEIESEETIPEEKVILKIKESSEAVEEGQEKESEISSKETNSDTIEIQDKNTEKVVSEEIEIMQTLLEESAENSQESDRLSDVIFENEESPEIETENEELDLKEEPESYVSKKRGEFIQDEGSGYYVNKAYKEEKANMDKSEEEMLNVWAQVSRENQQRKRNRRRQGMSAYNPVSPFAPVPEEVPEVKEEKPAQAEMKISSQTNVNTMTDEERRAAGYEYVTIDVNGKTLSFWQKRN